MTESEKNRAIELLHALGCSCVIVNGCECRVCRQRGVKDLYGILTENATILNGAFIADKVIGKGAAALMVLGGVTEVYADVISAPALRLLEDNLIPTKYQLLVDNIINRKGDGICPVELLCADCLTAKECLPKIASFLNQLN